MTEDAWPTPRESSREPLPRVEDLPIAEQGYEQESVRAAFDSFYRHAAQLDASLRTLEAVDSFHRQAAALRSDLRTLRAAGWTQQSWNVTPAYGYGMRAPREGVPPAVWRVAGEAAFLIAAAVIVGVAKLDWWLIVLIMAGAFTIVLLIEWIAGRESYVAPRQVAPPPVVEGETVGERTAEEEASGWSAFEESQEPSDAMTMVGAPPVVEGESEPVEPEVEQPEPVAEVESQPEEEAPEPEPIPEPEPGPELPPAAEAAPEPEPEREPETAADADEEADPPRRRWWRREPEDAGIEQDEEPSAHEPPRHVRVLPPTGEEHDVPAVDSWERGFDEPDESEPTGEDAVAEVGEDTAEGEPAVTVDGEASDRRRFRRR